MESQNAMLQNVPKDFLFVISVFYVNNEEQEAKIEAAKPQQRTLLLREGMETKFFLEY